ncbi:MAG: DUF4405 domain-containing protein [Armatimonadetes bacterium]|nr:DUF4405 domain-containing protein [Armatimonadota bacterium]
MDNEQTPKRFSFRAFTSMVVMFSFAVVALSGLIMLLWPGRSTQSVLGLGRHTWSGMHEWVCVLTVIAAAVHLWYNWRSVVAHVTRRRGPIRSEWIVALCLTAVVAAGAFLGGGEGGRPPGGPPMADGGPGGPGGPPPGDDG